MREPTVRLTTSQALIRFVQAQYSERDGVEQRLIAAIFGIFGHGNLLGIGQAIEQEGHELPLYQPKNEQAMVHAAIGYAKAARRLATLACTASIGPGATNMITGAATATTNRLPVLLLAGDTFAARRQGPVLQQLEHPIERDLTVNDAFRPVSRFFDRIARPEQLLDSLLEAMRVLTDPAETGAVTIALHQDVQGEAYDYPQSFFERRVWPVSRRPAALEELRAAATILREAERPLLIAGGGVRYSQAEDALRTFAEQLGIPVGETSAGKGSLVDSDWLLGGIGVNGTRAANEIARSADVVVCVGTRLSDFTTASHSLFQDPDVRFVAINVNASDAYKLSATSIVADAREGLDALRQQLGGYRSPSQHLRTVEQALHVWKADLAAEVSPEHSATPMRQGEVLLTLNRAAQPGDWVVAAAGYQPGDLLKMWEVVPGSFTHIEFAYSCMGHEIPAGIGIRIRERDAGEVFVVIGDGSYLMHPSELVTAAQEHLKVTVVVLDNGGYQSIEGLARTNLAQFAGNEFRSRRNGGRLPDGEFISVDYVVNAISMGCDAVRAETPAHLSDALDTARRSTRTTVIVCPTAPDRPLPGSEAFWDLGVPEVASSPATEATSVAHVRKRASQRAY
jgi:3D-(3,5/4)-trihydroxycyclohexane-1,2-dione acylhydrolase (decyclizing)